MVLPWNTSRTAESPSHSYFSFLPIQSFRSEWVFHTPPLYLCDCSPHLLAPTHLQPSTVIILWVYSCLFHFQSLLQLSPQSITITKLSCLSTTLFCSSQIILFNTPSFYLKQTIHFLIRCFFTYSIFSYTVITLPDGSIVGLVRPNDRIHPVLHSPSSEATATTPSLSHSDHDMLIKPFRVGTHR